jgi:hypothetical protein
MNRPEINLGYPTEAQGKIPSFRSVEEEAEFWDTHDIVDYVGDAPARLVKFYADPGSRSTVHPGSIATAATEPKFRRGGETDQAERESAGAVDSCHRFNEASSSSGNT